MGFGLGKVAAGIKGAASSEVYIQASAETEIAAPRESVFDVGSRKDIIPRDIARLALGIVGDDDDDAHLRKSDVLHAHVDLGDLGDTIVSLLKLRLAIDAHRVHVPMAIIQLEQHGIHLHGEVRRLGHCSLAIALTEYDAVTAVSAQLGITVQSERDVRAAAQAHSAEIHARLQPAMDEFVNVYEKNIRTALGV